MTDPRAVPPGWYPDGANIGFQRYWDGHAWTTDIARIAPKAPRASGGGPGRWIAIGFGVVAFLVLAGVVLFLGLESNGPAPSTRAASSALPLAEKVSVAPGDLPPGWGACCPPQVMAAGDLKDHICGSPSGLPARAAGYTTQFSLDLRPNGLEDGHLLSTAIVDRDERSAAREFTGVNAHGYQACVVPDLEAGELGKVVVIGRPTTTFVRRRLEVGHPSTWDQYVTKYRGSDGPHVVYTSVVRLLVGRVLVRFDVKTYASPIDDATIASVASSR